MTKENKLELCAVPHKFQFLVLGVCLENVARDDLGGCVNLQHLQTLVVCPSASVVQHVATGQENNERASILLEMNHHIEAYGRARVEEAFVLEQS